MVEHSRPNPSPDPGAGRAMAQLLDPVAWEARVSEARARRAEALAARRAAAPKRAEPQTGGLAGRNPSDAGRDAGHTRGVEPPAPPGDVGWFPGDASPGAADAGPTEPHRLDAARDADPVGAEPQLDPSEPPPKPEGPPDETEEPLRLLRPAPALVAERQRPADPRPSQPRLAQPRPAPPPRTGQATKLAILFVAGLALGLIAAFAFSTSLFERVSASRQTPEAAGADARAAVVPLPPGSDWVPATAPADQLAPVAEGAAQAADIALLAPAPEPAAAPAAEPAEPAAAPAEPAAGADPAPETAPETAGAPPSGLDEADAIDGARAVSDAPEPAAAAAETSPDLPVERPMPRPALAAVPLLPPAPVTAEPPLPSARVLVHLPSRAPAAAADQVAAVLAEAGLPPQGQVRVPVTIDRSNIRYYFPEDAAAARAAAERIAAATGQPIDARDFTDYRPRPEPGTLEVWLAGEGGRAAAPARTTAPSPGAVADAALRDLEALADEVARAIARTLPSN